MPEARKPKRQEPFRSLVTTLTVAFLTSSILVVLLSTGFGLVSRFQAQKKIMVDEQRLVAQSAASVIERFMAETFQALDQASDINNLATVPETRVLVMDKLIERNSAFRQLFLIDTQGQVLESVTHLSNQPRNPLETFKISVLADTLEGNHYISPVYIDATTGEPSVLIAVPTKNSLRETQGAFIAELNLKFMWDLVGNIHVGQKGQAYVVDKQGNLLAFKDTRRVLQHENTSTIKVVSDFMAGTEGTGTNASVGIQGTKVLTSYHALNIPDWAVIVEVPIQEAYAAVLPELPELWYVLLIVLLSGGLAVFSGVYLSKKITDDIVALRAAAEEISRGNLDARVGITSPNEIGRMAASFNAMAMKLQELYRSMGTKINEKTVALSGQVVEVENSKKAILNLLEDIDEEKKKVEQTVVERTVELQDEKSRLVASINSLSFGFALVDTADRIILKNPALSKILEFVKEPTTIKNIEASIKSKGSMIDTDIAAACRRSMDSREAVEFKEILYGKKFLRVICSPIVGDKAMIGYIFLVEDITEAKVLERGREEFFSIASHELRTPLTAIRGNADMLLEIYADKILDKDMKEMLVDINASSVRLISIVNDFLEVSRLEQGKIEIRNDHFDPDDLVKKVVRDLKEMTSEKGLKLKYTREKTAMTDILADKNRTEQVLVNLIGNAIKFTKEGTITVSFTQEGRTLRFRVTDTGAGISDHNQSLLFRKFQQAGEKILARDASQSTGLGLYISKLIVTTMGGEIGLEKSELGKGSTFFFTLPIIA